jgi:uncharacterized protein
VTLVKTSPEKKLDVFVKQTISRSSQGAHAYDHTKRVYALAMAIGSECGANLRIVGAAALLHDIGRAKERETGVSHAILSGEMSREVLQKTGYTEKEVEQVVEAIRTHRFSEDLTPSSLEGEILSDADKLDAIGAIGIFRGIAESVVENRDVDGFLDHAEEKLLKLHAMMHTDKARAMAEQRHSFLMDFVGRLREEAHYPDEP